MVNLIHWIDFPDNMRFILKEKENELLWNILNKKFRKLELSKKVDCSYKYLWFCKASRKYPKLLFLKLIRLAGLSWKVIEREIESYIAHGSVKVTKPKLPLIITPIFDNLVAHMMADGGELPNGTGFYKQKNPDTVLNFLRKLESVFGNYVQLKTEEKIHDDEGYIKTYIPKYMMQIIKNYYKIVSFRTKVSSIPKEIFSKPKENRLAFILAFIIDECCARRDRLIFSQKNKKLAKGLHQILRKLGYNPTKVKSDKKGNFIFRIYAPHLLSLWLDLLKVMKKYPILSFCHKEEDIKKVLKKHINQPWIKTLLSILLLINKKEICSTRDLYQSMKVYREIVYDKIKRLEKWGYLEIINKGKQKLLLFKLTKNGKNVATKYFKAYRLLGVKI